MDKRIEIPRTVKIGALIYDICHIFKLEDHNGRELYGKITHGSTTIELDRDMGDQRKAVTLIHEILHSILDQAGINKHPEKILTALAFGIYEMIRENPDLIEWINRCTIQMEGK